MVFDFTLEVQAKLGETAFSETSFGGGFGGLGWTSIMPDVRSTRPIVCRYGIDGASPNDRIASGGELTFLLDNSEFNSAAKLGYYSPFHVNKRTGFDFNIPIRLKLNCSGMVAPVYKYYGSLADIVPVAGRHEERATYCRVIDIMDDYARVDEPELPIQLNKRADEILTAMLDALDTQPPLRDIETGSDTYKVAMDGGTGQKLKVRERINQLCLSEFGYCYPKGDTTMGGTLAFESRHHRAANPTVMFALDDTMIVRGGLQTPGRREDFFHLVRVAVHPTNNLATASTIVLFALQTTSTLVLPSEVNDLIFGPYRDPSSNDLLGADTTSMSDPVATTDYTMNSLEDGSGTDLTANFTVTSSRTAIGVRFTITNNGIQSGYVTKLQQRGKPIYRFEALVEKSIDGSVGDQVLAMDMPFQNNVNVAQDLAAYLAQTLSTPFANPPTVTFLANQSLSHLQAAFEREPGDRITVTEEVTGINALHFTINGVRLEFRQDKEVWCTWWLEPASAQAFWLIGVPGASEIGETTVVGF